MICELTTIWSVHAVTTLRCEFTDQSVQVAHDRWDLSLRAISKGH
jgi:hypothetical protein